MKIAAYFPENLPQINARANLFYFLHTLFEPAAVKDPSQFQEEAGGRTWGLIPTLLATEQRCNGVSAPSVRDPGSQQIRDPE